MQRPFLKNLLALVLLGLLSCTKSGSTSKLTQKPGQFVFGFNPAEVTEISLAKNDPATGDRWSADLAFVPAKSKHEDSTWEIQSSSQGVRLQDKLADSNLLHHLLDTLKTVQYTSAAPRGPLTSFGLEPPRYAIRWKSGGRFMELRMGDAIQDSESAFYGQISSNTGLIEAPPLILKGSATKLLGYVTSFSRLRRQTLSLLASDDIDEIHLKRGTQVLLYAQREGDHWTDRHRRKIKKVDVGKLLDRFTHVRVKDFVDDPGLTQELVDTLKKSPAFEAIFTPRKGKERVMRLAWYRPKGAKEAKLWASDSGRNSAVFEAFPEFLHFFELPEK